MNALSSSWSSPRSNVKSGRKPAGGLGSGRTMWWWVAACLSVLPSCSKDDNGVTYNDEIRPLFNRRCTICHRPDGPTGVDIQNPFSTAAVPNAGLATSPNLWNRDGHIAGLPTEDVVAGDPDHSFLINKVEDPALGLLPATGAGSHMPFQLPTLSADEVHMIEDWVTAGAPNGAFSGRGGESFSYTGNVQQLFGVVGTGSVPGNLNTPGNTCDFTTSTPARPCARCVYCHYDGDGAPPPDLTNPFRTDSEGVVNVDSLYRSDIKRVEPGNPDRSLLVLKIRARNADQDYSDIGVQMPYSFDPLSASQVAVVRQWIQEGARP